MLKFFEQKKFYHFKKNVLFIAKTFNFLQSFSKAEKLVKKLESLRNLLELLKTL